MQDEELMKRLIALENLLISKKVITDDELEKMNSYWGNLGEKEQPK